MPERSARIDDVKAALGRTHVSFRVCEHSMKNQSVDKSQLLPNVGTVPDGIGEIVVKQTQGWGYIKAVQLIGSRPRHRHPASSTRSRHGT